MSLRSKRLSSLPVSISTQVESRACTSPGFMRRPHERSLSSTRLRLERHSLRQTLEQWEKSFSSTRLSSLSHRSMPFQTRLARLSRKLLRWTRLRMIPPLRSPSPQPCSGSCQLSERSQPSTLRSSQSVAESPISKPCTSRSRMVTLRRPSRRTPIPASLALSPGAPGPWIVAPLPSTRIPSAAITSGVRRISPRRKRVLFEITRTSPSCPPSASRAGLLAGRLAGGRSRGSARATSEGGRGAPSRSLMRALKAAAPKMSSTSASRTWSPAESSTSRITSSTMGAPARSSWLMRSPSSHTLQPSSKESHRRASRSAGSSGPGSQRSTDARAQSWWSPPRELSASRSVQPVRERLARSHLRFAIRPRSRGFARSGRKGGEATSGSSTELLQGPASSQSASQGTSGSGRGTGGGGSIASSSSRSSSSSSSRSPEREARRRNSSAKQVSSRPPPQPPSARWVSTRCRAPSRYQSRPPSSSRPVKAQ